jgi:hypothetical protein
MRKRNVAVASKRRVAPADVPASAASIAWRTIFDDGAIVSADLP